MTPQLASASDSPPDEHGVFAWDTTLNSDDLEYGQDGQRATWKQAVVRPGEIGPRIWVPVQSRARLHSGDFSWDFQIEEMGEAQIGVGFMLDWTPIGPDWGFYGYLGSSSSAWAYDPSTGDVVIATRSIQGGLPVLAGGRGTVIVEAHLPRHAPGLARFVINGTATKAFELPIGSVLVPAACLLGVGQNVTLGPLRNGKLDPASWPRDGGDQEAAEAQAEPLPEGSPASAQPGPGLLQRLKSALFGK